MPSRIPSPFLRVLSITYKPTLPTYFARNLHSSHPLFAKRNLPTRNQPSRSKNGLETISSEDALQALDEPFLDDDSASAGHLMLRQHRQLLYYLRLIEHDMPKLVAYRKPFTPPTSATPVIVRSLDYAGEKHPATVKRVLVVAVGDLPLRDEDAIHKFKVLAGPRWTPHPPSDAGVSGLALWGHGYIKISCEDFPEPAMNLKWASDRLDMLIAAANDPKDKFKRIPLDMRHVYAKARKAKKGEHIRSRVLVGRPTIRDFPEDWLPTSTKPPNVEPVAQ